MESDEKNNKNKLNQLKPVTLPTDNIGFKLDKVGFIPNRTFFF